jgi:hypothetical protein
VLDEAASWNTRTVVRPIVPIELHARKDPGR